MATRDISVTTWGNKVGSATAQITITHNTPEGVETYALDVLSNTSSVCAITTQSLASGANTITVPTDGTNPKCSGVAIIPPSGNAQTLTLKGVTGDTGVPLNPNGVNLITFPTASTTNFCLTAGGAVAGGVRFLWF